MTGYHAVMRRLRSPAWRTGPPLVMVLLVAAPLLVAFSLLVTSLSPAHVPSSRPAKTHRGRPKVSSSDHLPPPGKVYVGVSEIGTSYAQFLKTAGLPRVAIADVFTAPNEDVHGILEHFAPTGPAAMISWDFPGNGTMASIADGRYDSYIKRVAAEARKYARPLFIRLDWEFNGHWYPWSAQTRSGQLRKGNSPSEYVAAWRHVVRLFGSAPNATFVWCPTLYHVVHSTRFQVSAWYPGNAYVGWIGLDSYLGSANWKYMQFGPAALDADYAFAKAHHKPVMIAEWALSRPGPGDSPSLVSLFWNWMKSHPLVRAELWFNFDSSSAQHKLIDFPRSARELRGLLQQPSVLDRGP